MLKKILIGIGITAVILIALVAYLNHKNRTLSPPGHVEASNEGLNVSIQYSRPSVRDRIIFGTEEEKALQPYGVYWRLGANEATEMTINQDVLFNGEPLSKGTYTVYAVPGQVSFTIGVNSGLDRWGYAEPDYELDVLTTEVPVERVSNTEQFTIELKKVNGGLNTVVLFSDVKLTIPIRVPS